MAEGPLTAAPPRPDEGNAGAREAARAPTVSVVVPMFNKGQHVAASLESIVRAAAQRGDVEVIVVDHGSTDGSLQIARGYAPRVTVLDHRGGTVAAVRNVGARSARGHVLSFVDCDCVLPPDYFDVLLAVLDRTEAGAAGCEVGVPAAPHWIEKTWDDLHAVRVDGWRHYINSGNFSVTREAFDRVGGWDESMVTGEDTDICKRLRAAGYGIYEAHALNVQHLDNPKSVRAFFRKEVWHGLGALGGRTPTRLDKITLMVLAHAGLSAASAALLAGALLRRDWRLAGLALLLVLAAPMAALAYRVVETRRLPNPAVALFLYTVYFFARTRALLSIAASAVRRPRAEPDRAPRKA
jgi:hypothetical protein